jgi:hypothetical protein
MAKLLGPDFLSLQVRDLAVSRAFYIRHVAELTERGVAVGAIETQPGRY